MIIINPTPKTTPELPIDNFALNSDDVEVFASLWQRKHWADVPHTLSSEVGLAVESVAAGSQNVNIYGSGTLAGNINKSAMIKIGNNYHLVSAGGSAAGNKISITIFPGAPSGGYANGTPVKFCDSSLEVHDFQLGYSTWTYQPGFRVYQLIKPANCGYNSRPVGFFVRHRPSTGENGIDYNTILFRPFYAAKYQMSRSDSTPSDEGTSTIAVSKQGTIPWTNINIDKAAAACTASDTVSGKDLSIHLISDDEWVSLGIYSMILGPERFGSNRWGPYGNNSSLKDCDDNDITFIADPTISGRALTGTGRKSGWEAGKNLTSHTGHTNGVYDLNGNIYEWTTGLKLKVGSSGMGYLYVNEMDTGIQMSDTSSNRYVTALSTDVKVAKHAIASTTDNTGRAEFGNDYQYQGTSANSEYVAGRGGDWSNGADAGVFYLYLAVPVPTWTRTTGFAPLLKPDTCNAVFCLPGVSRVKILENNVLR